MKTIAVTGATGVQGSSVIRALLENKQWKVRALTRNPDGEAARALVSQGVDVVFASFDDEDSLVNAFKDVNAIFALTNFWEHLLAGKSQTLSGETEASHALTIARAAAKIATLEDYILSTLPSTSDLTGGKVSVPHFDYKAKVDQRIRELFPALAAKTTYLYFGFYPQNMAYFPLLKPFQIPLSGAYVWLLPTNSSTIVPIAGDINITAGLWVSRILANPQKTRGKYTSVVTEFISVGNLIKEWGQGTGKRVVLAECSEQDFETAWGVAGNEMRLQFKFHEIEADLTRGVKEQGSYVSAEELGINVKELGGVSEVFKTLKENWA
ncbi:hypothetical protein F5884DRAFT_868671 [Xylogone sp. PMI_703]|nr:hypothetical protein F5884DRAFT_868671 [Xylogone sp. PMI_703]